MTTNFDRALQDLGFTSFNGKNFFDFSLQRENYTSITVSLYHDERAATLRITAYTSGKSPASFNNQFFRIFAQAALEPLRGGIGVGIPEGEDRLCVYLSLPVSDYQPGHSVLVLEQLIEQVEKWDELLNFAGD